MVERRFAIGLYEIDGPILRVHVAGERGLFIEEVEFDVDLIADDGMHRLAQIASVAIATSYAKLEPFDVLELPDADAELEAYASSLFDHGLREYRYRNGLELDQPPRVESAGRAWTDALPTPRDVPPDSTGDRPSLVAIGGGKDSALTLRVIDRTVAVCVNPSPAVRHLCSAAGVELRSVLRRLDPRLAEVTAAGGLNGHIPVTAINSALLAMLAHQIGCPRVVFANERSAEEPTRVVDGMEVNHQWSKSLAFEQMFASLVEPVGMEYWSLTRGMSDIAVGARVVGDGVLVRDFVSCNRAFRLDDIAAGVDNRGAWCAACDKCAFTFLTFALFLPPSVLVEIFGRDMLAEPANVELFERLATPGTKPFDCVGEIDESRAAFGHLARSQTWGDAAVVVALGALGQSAPPVEAYLPISRDRVPAAWRSRLDAVPVAVLVP